MNQSVVFGIYSTQPQVAAAIADLKKHGFRGTDFSVLAPENAGNKDLGHVRRSKAWEAGALACVAGMIVGGILGAFIADGIVPVGGHFGGLDTFIAAGELMATLAGAGLGAAAGLIIGGLVGLRFPEYVARRYTGRIRRGNILLSVHCDDHPWTRKAEHVLNQTGATDVAASQESAGDYNISEKPKLRYFGT